jgi:hypothetical protein
MYNKAAANTNIIVLCLNQPLIKPHHKLPGTTKVVLIVSLLFEPTVDQTTPQASRYYKGSFDCQSFV